MVHGVEEERSILLRGSSRQKADSGQGRYDGAGQGADGVPRHLRGGGPFRARGTLGHHVGFEHAALDAEALIEHRLHNCGEDTFGDSSTGLDRVVAVLKDFGLDDGHEAVVLADGAVAGKGPGGLLDGELRGHAIADFQDGTPLGEAAALLVECLTTGGQAVQTLGGGLIGSAADFDDTLVELDTDVDTTGAKLLGHGHAIVSLLIDCLLVEDYAGDMLVNFGSGNKEVSVSLAVCLGVLYIYASEALPDRASGFVSGENTFSRGADFFGNADKFFFERISVYRNHFDWEGLISIEGY
mmetsp:Transcript_25348/g.50499  ORF Transcript_25348/g.50499 Transcript_25348/m.50499 type:complete len:298 (-) Transcript_25348:47-940(-)